MIDRIARLSIDDPTLSGGERSFRLAWMAASAGSDGVPRVSADYVARQGRILRVIDIRDEAALHGPLGHVPGSDWVPYDEAGALHTRVGAYEPTVLVCEDGSRSGALAAWLEQAGLRVVAAMDGGMQAWRVHGLLPARDPELPSRRGELAPVARLDQTTGKDPFSLEAIAAHVGNPRSVRWLKLAAFLLNGRMACVDGRDATAVVGSPGGDAGEFVLALGALERLLGRALSDGAIDTLLGRRIEAFGRFAFHTDVGAGNRMIAAIRKDPRTAPAVAGITEYVAFRRFFANPPREIRGALSEIMVQPDHVGCGHLKLTIQRAEEWGVRDGLTQRVLQSAMALRWDGLQELEITPLPGGHCEGAVLNVRVAEPMHPFAYVPLVAPSIEGRQLFVNHPDVATYLRSQLARWLVLQDDLFTPPSASALEEAMASLHGQQLAGTLGALAAGLPVFDAVVRRDGAPLVTLAGHV